MIAPVATHSTVLASVDGRTKLTVESTTTSAGTLMVGFGVRPPLASGAPTVTWLYFAEFAAAIAGAFGLNIIGPGGAPFGDRHSWIRRRGVELADDGTFTVVSRATPNPTFTLHAQIKRPVVGWSPRGNPTITPVNDRVLVEIRIDDDSPALIDPSDLLAVLIDHGVVIRYEDWNGILTRHRREPAAAIEILTDGSSMPRSMMGVE